MVSMFLQLFYNFDSLKMDSDEEDLIQMPHQYQREQQYSDEEERHHPKSQDSDAAASDSHNSSSASHQLTHQQKLQYDLLKLAIQKQNTTPYQQEITREIISKLNDLSAAQTANGQELVNIRIQELALNKLLVLNYGMSDFRLVIAHYHLGQAYLAYQCVEQAIEHISVALHKNEKLIKELSKTELLQINMHIAVAEAYISQNNFDEAIQILNKAREIQQRFNQALRQEGEQPNINIKALVLKSQCLCKQKNFEQALEVIDEVVHITKTTKLSKIQYAFALVEKATILSDMNTTDKSQKAVEFQEEAINILVQENYQKPEEVAELYSTLAQYYENIANAQSSLTCIQKVKTLYEELFSPEDKRVIKARRKIATTLLKSSRHKEAVAELLEIAKLEEKVFGESIQLARTLKLLGTVYISLSVGDARVYLKRAMTIFQNLGHRKQVQEIREKLKNLLSENNRDTDLHLISQQDI